MKKVYSGASRAGKTTLLFEDVVREIFTGKPTGKKRLFWYNGYWWRCSDKLKSLEISEDLGSADNYGFRKPTEEEREIINKFVDKVLGKGTK